MTLTHCKLCLGTNIFMRYRMDEYDLDILRCSDCGFLFVDFFNAECNDAMETDWDFAAHAPGLAGKFSAYTEHIMQYVDLRDKAVLDIGAGGGDFLNQARLRGARPAGIDLDRTGTRFAKEAYGIELHACLLEELNLPDASMDVVTMWEVAEHLNDPKGTMQEIARIVRPGGWILLSTPCLDSLWDRAGFALYSLSFGHIQFPLTYRFSWTHLQIFSRRHMERLLRDFGFEIRFYHQRTELTYPTADYLRRLRPRLLRKPAEFVWNAVKEIIPLGNKMVVYAQKGISED